MSNESGINTLPILFALGFFTSLVSLYTNNVIWNMIGIAVMLMTYVTTYHLLIKYKGGQDG